MTYRQLQQLRARLAELLGRMTLVAEGRAGKPLDADRSSGGGEGYPGPPGAFMERMTLAEEWGGYFGRLLDAAELELDQLLRRGVARGAVRRLFEALASASRSEEEALALAAVLDADRVQVREEAASLAEKWYGIFGRLCDAGELELERSQGRQPQPGELDPDRHVERIRSPAFRQFSDRYLAFALELPEGYIAKARRGELRRAA